ncbi:hypothetical protein FPZ12_040305 [Amycolatopsis acidicola]|uniref:Uncharacterized protein n=1 Tax=Amycolatopsis acidicola TaxID=2596893 RepID=A0A5N0UQG2_9PSEU|nr:hypothetical protein [Amycolatopsis acidicola]KAA9150841.1 hypothetical protein FPZ12_040305 [Amycolatopsis acidicola]
MSRTDQTTPVEQRLSDLIDRGYRFLHPRADDGAVVAVVGIRAHGAVVDIVRLDGEDDATAFRVPEDEPNVLAPRRMLWRCRGEAGDVLEELLALPDCDDSRLLH